MLPWTLSAACQENNTHTAANRRIREFFCQNSLFSGSFNTLTLICKCGNFKIKLITRHHAGFTRDLKSFRAKTRSQTIKNMRKTCFSSKNFYFKKQFSSRTKTLHKTTEEDGAPGRGMRWKLEECKVWRTENNEKKTTVTTWMLFFFSS